MRAGGDYASLPWWKDYNSLKHDRLMHINKGTLKTTINACGALQQVIARRLDLVPMLVRRRWLSTGRLIIDYVLSEAKEGRLPATFVVQTRLFATPTGKEQFPDKLSELKPGLFECKMEFIEFMGKTYV